MPLLSRISPVLMASQIQGPKCFVEKNAILRKNNATAIIFSTCLKPNGG